MSDMNPDRIMRLRSLQKWFVPEPEWTPNYTLDRKIAEARESMGEPRWNELNQEWNDGR